MRDATFVRGDATAGPVTLDLRNGEGAALHCASEREATIIALLACGIVKTSSGCVLIGDFDPHVQSVHCKRAAAFVPHQPLPLDDGEFARYIAYRAALWNIEPARARERAEMLRERLAGVHEAFAYPLIGALIGEPKLLALDRPQTVYAREIRAVTEGYALFSTHTDAAAAKAFT